MAISLDGGRSPVRTLLDLAGASAATGLHKLAEYPTHSIPPQAPIYPAETAHFIRPRHFGSTRGYTEQAIAAIAAATAGSVGRAPRDVTSGSIGECHPGRSALRPGVSPQRRRLSQPRGQSVWNSQCPGPCSSYGCASLSQPEGRFAGGQVTPVLTAANGPEFSPCHLTWPSR